MTALYLTEDDVREILDVETAVEIVRDVFHALAEDRAVNIPRSRAAAGRTAVLHVMSGAAEYLGYLGWKAYSTTRAGARFHVGLYEAQTGQMAALIEADYLGQLRTGAASGVATEYMARHDARTVGLFGAGKQARTQLKAVCTVRHIEYAQVFSRDAVRREQFAREMSEYCGTRVVAARSPEETATEKDIVICASTSKVPVFEGRWLVAGAHVNAVGSNYLTKAEIDVETVRRADTIVCDSIEACRNEAGDFVEALEAGVTDWALMHDLADVVAGRETGRALAEHITLFKSVGLAVEDVAIAARLLDRAREEGLGRPLPF